MARWKYMLQKYLIAHCSAYDWLYKIQLHFWLNSERTQIFEYTRACGGSNLMTSKATKGFVQFAKNTHRSGNDNNPKDFPIFQPIYRGNHCWADIFPLQPELCHILHNLPKLANREGVQGELEPNRNSLWKPQRPCKPKCPGCCTKYKKI